MRMLALSASSCFSDGTSSGGPSTLRAFAKSEMLLARALRLRRRPRYLSLTPRKASSSISFSRSNQLQLTVSVTIPGHACSVTQVNGGTSHGDVLKSKINSRWKIAQTHQIHTGPKQVHEENECWHKNLRDTHNHVVLLY